MMTPQKLLIAVEGQTDANILRAQIVECRLEQVLFRGAIEHSHVRAFGFE